MSINTNVASQNAQRQLAASQSSLSASMQRLSSGLRVNSAKDDAAGLAIAERMNAQVRGMNVAVRNTNDGISLAQTAEGALGKVADSLQRMRELALQANNATNSASDKDSLNKEFAELQKEITRVIGGTSFNGKAILGADAGTMSFQVGANVGTNDTIDLALTDLTANAKITAVTSSGPTPAQLTAANAAVGSAVAPLIAPYQQYVDSYAAHYTDVTSAAGAAGEAIRATVYDLNGASDANAAIAGLDAATSGAEAYNIAYGNAQALGWVASYFGNLAQAAYEAFDAAAPSGGGASIGSGTTATDIAQVITDLDAAIGEINDQRATFGATQSRFESVISNLQISVENQSAARGRIMDADFAVETASLSRAQILQQAGNAMVAQANQLPQQVLSLLR